MTSVFERGLGRVRALTTEMLATKTILMRNQRAIVSFTFDDFPHTAVSRGAKILEKYGQCGTFYAAGSLCEQTIDGANLFNPSDLSALNVAGHEIGCHTFDHVPISRLTTHALRRSLDKNAEFVAGKIPGYLLSSFAYPFGDVSPFLKPFLQRHFSTCRGTRHGLNIHKADLGFLRAVRLYSHQMNKATILELIDEAVAKAAWLIFYTHDVEDAPSQYGCTPELLEYAVQVAASKADVLAIRNALGAVRYGDHYRPEMIG